MRRDAAAAAPMSGPPPPHPPDVTGGVVGVVWVQPDMANDPESIDLLFLGRYPPTPHCYYLF
jgi:hypothetical protein